MLASVEYMLCGLPQVSTRCRGGRELFFDQRYVMLVDSTPEAVAAGVLEMVARSVNPRLVRAETIEKVQPHRDRFCKYISAIIRRRGGAPPAPSVLANHLFDSADGIRRWFVPSRDFQKHGLA